MTGSTMPTSNPLDLPHPARDFIIHRPPMLLIDTLIERTGDEATALAAIAPGNICFDAEKGLLPEYYIEIIAQTMAAANGYDALLNDAPPPGGFIVGLTHFTLHAITAPADTFVIKISKTFEFGSMKVMHGEVFSGERTIATAELQVWEQEKK
jgi:predicted hotdog family 3-hydroxylacyl-ACP dehydratase